MNDDWFEGAPLGQVVYERTYSRTKEDGSKETWPETVERVVDGNLALVDARCHEDGERDRLISLIRDRKMLPGGRHLWMSGVADRSFLFNCHRAGWGTLADHVAFTFDELMKGGGVGCNYSQRYVSKLAPVRSKTPVLCSYFPVTGTGGAHGNIVIVVEDSRQGWVSALKSLILASGRVSTERLVFDLSNIRGKGEPIRTFGGIAAGPEPLAELLYFTADFLNDRVGKPWKSLDLMALDHAIATCVVSGNVRRSARMSMLHWKDPEIDAFLACKQTNPEAHWSTNISVEVDQEFVEGIRGGHVQAHRVFGLISEGMLLNGEPGIYNSYLAGQGERGDVACTNPCGEIALEEWENCNLGHVNLANTTQAEKLEAFRLMARFLLRATFGDVENEQQWKALQKNRRIGVGFFGLQEYLAGIGIKLSEAARSRLPADLHTWKATVRREADAYARMLGIAKPVKVTTVAPTGTVAKLAGTSEGIHPIYSRYYVRRVRFASNDPLVEQYRAEGLEVEDDIYTPDTVCVLFPTKDPVVERVGDRLIEQANELDLCKALRLQEMVQRYYADNAVSHTINVEPGTIKPWELRAELGYFLPVLKGVTVMVDESRPQAPLTRITKEQYEALTKSEQEVSFDVDLECASGACPVR